MRAFTAAMRVPIRLLNGSANAFVRRLGLEPQEELRSARSSTELASLISRSASVGTLDPDTAELMERSVEFGTRTAGEIMTPRVRTLSLEEGDRALQVIELARSTGHSRFPVLDAGDAVVGTVHVKNAVALPVHERSTTRVKHLMAKPIVVPDSLRLDPLLALLRKDGFQLAVVLDEYGGHAGIVTLEDVVEEIVGDISDEHDRFGSRARKRRDGSWLLSGLLRPDEVEDLTGVLLPESEDYDTVAGLVLQVLGRIPERGDIAEVAGPGRLRRRGVPRAAGHPDRRAHGRAAHRPGRAQPPRRTGPAEGGGAVSAPVALAVAFLLLLGNAFFVGAEFALVSARRTQIEPRAEAGSAMAKITLRAMENMSLVIGVNQLGITVCSLVLGAVGEPAVAHLVEPVLHALHVPESFLHPIAFVIALSIVVYLHVVLGEMIPKNLALAGPDRAALVLGPPIWAIVTVLRPVIRVINACASAILRLFGVRIMDEVSSTYTREEVAALVEESRGEGLIEPEEYDRLAGALGFTEKPVSTVLMPPASLTTVRRGSTPADVEALCAATGFSRFPVVDDRDGDLLGYLHIKDVLETDESAAAAGDRGQVGAPVRAGRRGRPAARRAGDPPAQGRAHGGGRRPRPVRRWAWPPSRTSSRSWSARSATRRTRTRTRT